VEVLESSDPVYGAEARCMLTKSDRKQVKLWEKTVAAHGTRADAHVGLARARLHAGDLDGAAAQVDEAIRLDPTDRAILLMLCREYVSEGDHARARQSVERYLAAPSPHPAPLRAWATFCLAKIRQMEGDRAQADDLLAEAKRIDPRVWTTYMEPSEVLFEAP
jgi:tetratricopeptide (TPR) repeat protein